MSYNVNYFAGVDLADSFGEAQQLEIEVVIGQADYWKVITVADAIQVGSVVGLKSLFGYVISGSHAREEGSPSSQLLSPVPSMQLLCPQTAGPLPVANLNLEKFWDL